MRALKVWLISAGFACLSCENNSSPTQAQVQGQDSIVHVSLTALASDTMQTARYVIDNSLQLEQEVNGESISIQNDFQTTADISLQRLADTGFVIHLLYRDLTLDLKSGDFEKHVRASEAARSGDPQERIFSAFHNAKVTAYFNPAFQLRAISGLKDIREDMRRQAGDNENALAMLNGTLKEMFSEQVFSKMLQQIAHFIPGDSLKIGQTWTITEKLPLDLKASVPVKFELKRIQESAAIIELNGAIDLQQATFIMQGQPVSVSLKGKQSGSVSIDIRTGLLKESQLKFAASGHLITRATETPLTIRSSVSISQRKQ